MAQKNYCLELKAFTGELKHLVSLDNEEDTEYMACSNCLTEQDFWVKPRKDMERRDLGMSVLDFHHHNHWKVRSYSQCNPTPILLNGTLMPKDVWLCLTEGDTFQIQFVGMNRPVTFSFHEKFSSESEKFFRMCDLLKQDMVFADRLGHPQRSMCPVPKTQDAGHEDEENESFRNLMGLNLNLEKENHYLQKFMKEWKAATVAAKMIDIDEKLCAKHENNVFEIIEHQDFLSTLKNENKALQDKEFENRSAIEVLNNTLRIKQLEIEQLRRKMDALQRELIRLRLS